MSKPPTVELPAPSAWPITLAFGITLMFACPVTDPLVGVVGVVISIVAVVGWCKETFVGGGLHIAVPAVVDAKIHPVEDKVNHLELGKSNHRARIPMERVRYRRGVWAGLAGGAAMSLVACGYGLIAKGSLWYPINILVASIRPAVAGWAPAQLLVLDETNLALATGMHLGISILMGILYLVLLPMLSSRPILVGGMGVPLMWSSVMWASMGIINPVLQEHIFWPAFILSQSAFGLAAGFVVYRSKRVQTMQTWSLAERAGLEFQPEDETGGDDG
jgi:hypothetical protein